MRVKDQQFNAMPHSVEVARQSLRRRVVAMAVAVVAVVGAERGYNNVLHHQDKKIAQLNRSLSQKDEQLQRVAGILAAQSDVNKDTVLGEGLGDPDKLPGRNHFVEPERQKLLDDSALLIVRRYKNQGPSDWSPWCSANKVRIGNQIFIASAGHCFSEDLDNLHFRGGDPNSESYSINVKNGSGYEYAVRDPRNSGPEDIESTIIARIDGISMDISGIDWALLQPVIPDPVSRNGSRLFSDIPTLDYSGFSVLPEPGQEAALYSAPAANGNEPIIGRGTYLGRIFQNSKEGEHHFDIVGISTNDPRKDACNYGASGSSSVLADGYVTGPLAARNNISFGQNAPDNSPDNANSGQIMRLSYEEDLGLDLHNFQTLCFYSVPYKQTIDKLVKGFATAPLPQPAAMK